MARGWWWREIRDIDDFEDLVELLFSWQVVISALSFLLLVWSVLKLLSLRTRYSLKGKHVLITGGSSGIGKAVAMEALRRGAAMVTIVARNKEKLKAAETELQRLVSNQQKARIKIISTDLCSDNLHDDLLDELSGEPPVDVLVNSAGVSIAATFLDTTPEEFEKQLRGNIMGSVRPTQALLPGMIERGEGRIVFISSMAGQMPLHGYTAYSASKYGVRGLAEVLDMELKVHNIRVSVSYPPDTDTPMLREELGTRSSIMKAQANYGSTFEAGTIARDICSGVERGVFSITHGFDGFLLGTMATGMSPTYHWVTILNEVLLMGLFRLIGCVYVAIFYHIVSRETKKTKKQD